MDVRTRIPHRIVVSKNTSVLRETNYERVTSAAWAVFLGLLAACIVLMVLWTQVQIAVANADPQVLADPIQTIEFEQTETVLPELVLQSPDVNDPENLDATIVQLRSLMETVDSRSAYVAAMVDDEAVQVSDVSTSGPLGRRVVRPERNWLFEIQNLQDDSDYKLVLDHFGIEPAAVFPDGAIIYLSNLSTTTSIRKTTDLEAEKRFFMFWTDGTLAQVDEKLFADAGIDTNGAKCVQFLPFALEDELAQLELDFAGKTAEQIRCTWFRLSRNNGVFEFQVSRQAQIGNLIDAQ